MADAYAKLMALIERIERRYWWINFTRLKNDIKSGAFRVSEIERASAKFKYDGTGDLSFFWCKNCNHILKAFTVRGCVLQGSKMRCMQCGQGTATQAYVGAPRWDRGSKEIEYYNSQGGSILLPISRVAWCRRVRAYKILNILDEERPVASATFRCPDPNVPCPYRDQQGFCREGGSRRQRLFFPRWRGIRYYPSHVSEALTKPLILTTYSAGKGEPVIFDHEALPGVEEIRLAPLRIYEVGLLIFLGHPYASYSERLPRIPRDSMGPFMLGRRFDTEGIIIRLNETNVLRACNELRERGFKNRDAVTVVHSFAHAVLNSLPLLSGLSPSEFGESLFVSEEEGYYELVIYDNSKGSIGGVRSIISGEEGSWELAPDIYAYFVSATECKRGCEVACRACLFYERCIFLNKILNRHALPYIISVSGCKSYTLTDVEAGAAA